MAAKVVIIMGSKGDRGHAESIVKTLQELNLPYELRVCSAHKATRRLLEILESYEGSSDPIVYITIAGRSNALSAVVDANTRFPVIACPPYSDRFAGMDVLSSLRLPSGIASPTILEPDGAALLAAKMLALFDQDLAQRLATYRERFAAELERADAEVRGHGGAGA
ncbi:MAG: AIR carboxylase family protein [Thermogemmatispora sp.]|jgi:5-(carboxyamino)imidazole ribonucleotide mutase|uniref:AIR carboxylase family protein n=1 Tax=Thermogemmatispora sp. TaxID=1968838 RepID=UPI00262A827A|nr:AIR carboxylase family protein [Thermogemmatispora sp.]MBX5455383.1 AIR carboxylase family protein [Thermogemmatispora sp.]